MGAVVSACFKASNACCWSKPHTNGSHFSGLFLLALPLSFFDSSRSLSGLAIFE